MGHNRMTPPAPLLRSIPWVFLLAGGAGAWLLNPPTKTSTASASSLVMPLRAEQTSMLERQWIGGALPPRFLPAPVGPPPCARGFPPSWHAPLRHANNYVRQGRMREAEATLDSYLSSPEGRQLVERVTQAANTEGITSGPSSDDVRAALHLLQTSAFVQIERNGSGERFWRDLKNPIGYAKVLSRRGEMDATPNLTTWTRFRIASPGCAGSPADLTTHHLYNNLILGYLRTPGFQEPDPRKREKEFERGYRDPPEDNPLQAVLTEALREPGRHSEGWRWTLSNAERLLREITWKRPLASLEVEPWIAVNLAQIVDSARVGMSPELRQSLRRHRDALTAAAARTRRQVPEQSGALAHALTRLLLLQAVEADTVPQIPGDLQDALTESQRAAIGAVVASLSRRNDPRGISELVLRSDGGPEEASVPDVEQWNAAMRQDLATHFARQGRNASGAERDVWRRRAQEILAPGDPVPEELRMLQDSKLPPWLLSWLPVVVSALAAALVGAYVSLVLRRRRSLWVSYYRQEALERDRGRG